MEGIIAFIFIVTILVFIVKFFKKIFLFLPKRRYDDEEKLPYTPKWNFMTPSEYKFFKIIEQIAGDKYYIIPQVQLTNLLYISLYNKQHRAYRNKIDRKSVDFAFFTKEDYKFHLAIELDDSSHEREDRIERDEFVEEAMEDAGLKLLRIKLRPVYNIEFIENLKILLN